MAFLAGLGLAGKALKKAFDDIWAKKVVPSVRNSFYQTALQNGLSRVSPRWRRGLRTAAHC